MALTETLIINTYSELKQKAGVYLNKGNIHKALLYTHLAAYTNHSFFLSYYDKELEDIVKAAGEKIDRNNSHVYSANKKRCVLLDSLSKYRGGFTVQYVNAIEAAGWELLYITEQEMEAPHHKELYEYLKTKKGVKIVEVPKKYKGKSKLQFIYDTIIDYHPYRLYAQLNAFNAYLSAVTYALPSSIIKYHLDIADHAFILGYQSGDYSFEFRSLGCSIAAKYREKSIDSMLYLPFYPIIDNIPFKGLPDSCSGKKIILSGGRFFKIIDAEDTFFKLIQKLIKENPDTVILYPGSGNDTLIRQKITQYDLADNFILLGWRDDISELFRHADIFLNTYPHGGATMSQYAAHLHVPILSYKPIGGCPNPVECFVCQADNIIISSTGEDEFLCEAHRLLTDKEYRIKKAEETYKCVLGVDKFNYYFKKLSETCNNIIPFEVDDTVRIDERQMYKMIDYHNRTYEYQMRLVALIGINSITLNKTYITAFLREIGPKLMRVIKHRGLHFNRI